MQQSLNGRGKRRFSWLYPFLTLTLFTHVYCAKSTPLSRSSTRYSLCHPNPHHPISLSAHFSHLQQRSSFVSRRSGSQTASFNQSTNRESSEWTNEKRKALSIENSREELTIEKRKALSIENELTNEKRKALSIENSKDELTKEKRKTLLIENSRDELTNEKRKSFLRQRHSTLSTNDRRSRPSSVGKSERLTVFPWDSK